MSRCRVCGGQKNVLCYDPRGLRHYFDRKTYCPEHCPEHEFSYHRDFREWACDICSESAPQDFWAYHPD